MSGSLERRSGQPSLRSLPCLSPLISFNKYKWAQSLARAGDFSAASRALSSPGAVDSAAHIAELKALHPDAPPPRRPSLSSVIPFDKPTFIEAVKCLKTKKTADAAGWRAEFLKSLNEVALGGTGRGM